VIPGPLAAPPVPTARPWRSEEEKADARRRVRITLGIVLIALGILGVVAWGIFLSPFGFSRFPLAARYSTFTAHQSGEYAVYLEGPGESQPSLPPALDIEVAPTSGERIDLQVLGTPGHVGAPDAYHVGSHEGRAIAVVTVHHSGTFLLSVEAKQDGQFNPDNYAPVTSGTIAVGRGFGRGWPTTQWCGLVLFLVPAGAGVILLTTARRRRLPD
jgi:hypothetical protein